MYRTLLHPVCIVLLGADTKGSSLYTDVQDIYMKTTAAKTPLGT